MENISYLLSRSYFIRNPWFVPSCHHKCFTVHMMYTYFTVYPYGDFIMLNDLLR